MMRKLLIGLICALSILNCIAVAMPKAQTVYVHEKRSATIVFKAPKAKPQVKRQRPKPSKPADEEYALPPLREYIDYSKMNPLTGQEYSLDDTLVDPRAGNYPMWYNTLPLEERSRFPPPQPIIVPPSIGSHAPPQIIGPRPVTPRR